MAVILLTSIDWDNVQKMREAAEASPLTMDDILDANNGEVPEGRDMSQYIIAIARHAVSFMHEDAPKGMQRHMCISQGGGKLPSYYLAVVLMPRLGFRNHLDKCMVTRETIEGRIFMHIKEFTEE